MFLGAVSSRVDSASNTAAASSTVIIDDPVASSIINKDYKDEEDQGSENLLDSLTSENIHTTDKEGFEVVTRVDLGVMPIVERTKPVDVKQIEYDQHGRILRPDELKKKIFRGVSFKIKRLKKIDEL